MKLGVNSVLFGGHDMETAFKYTQLCGYDGIELSAIDGMSEHLVLDRWKEIASRAKELSKQYSLPILAMEQPSQDPAKVELAFQAASDIGIPIVNCGPGGNTSPENQRLVGGASPSASRIAGAVPTLRCGSEPTAAASPGSLPPSATARPPTLVVHALRLSSASSPTRSRLTA